MACSSCSTRPQRQKWTQTHTAKLGKCARLHCCVQIAQLSPLATTIDYCCTQSIISSSSRAHLLCSRGKKLANYIAPAKVVVVAVVKLLLSSKERTQKPKLNGATPTLNFFVSAYLVIKTINNHKFKTALSLGPGKCISECVCVCVLSSSSASKCGLG